MDVDKVQKINNLALELMKQGLAQDREQAVVQAEKILSKEDYSSLKDAVDEVKDLNIKQGEEKIEEELTQDKIKDILEKNTTFIVKKMKENQELIEGLKGEINTLKNEINSLRNSITNLRATSQPQNEAKKEPQQKLAAQQTSKENHPRSGSYNDTDVSIEKFFYAGSRPKE